MLDRLTLSMLATLGSLAAFGACFANASEKTGEQVYRQKCAACHGPSGEGTKDFPRSLEGDRSIVQLTRLIEKTMPEDDPGTCVGPEAEKVAAFIFDAFYSKAARERNTPPRLELSRLTVRQYRNTLTDLIGAFRWNANWDWQAKGGLRGEYFKSRHFNDNDRVIDREDPVVDFNFKQEGPEPGKFDPHEFSIRWQGSLFAPETGEYEFIVKTEHATRLIVNDPKAPVIDAWVKSGNDNEYHGTVFLLGGRVYPLKLEFSKAKQGVDDSKLNKGRPIPPASIHLEWKPPGLSAQVIPPRNLSPKNAPEVFVAKTPFPPDDRSQGYERGTTISKAWDQATTNASIETAHYISDRLREFSSVKDDDPERLNKTKEFCRKFAGRAFRRPLTDEQAKVVVDAHFGDGKDLETSLKRVVLLVLKSPRFLYREVNGTEDAYLTASRLAFNLWDSLPDQTLLDAAASGQLATREQVTSQAERMVNDLRTRAKVSEFFHQWLRVEQAPDLSKDPDLYPDFTQEIASDLRTSLDLTLNDILWSDASDFRQLLVGEDLYLNGRLANFYGIEIGADAPFQKVAPDTKERSGVLSHPYLMARFAYTGTSSPIHRGVFIARSLLGRGLRPPPEAVAPLAPDLHAGLTTRERVTLQTSPAACMTCHGMVNPLGFGLEQFDAVGRFRAFEKSKPIDSGGQYEDPIGSVANYQGARALATLIADSDETHAAFVDQLFHYMVKQPIRAHGPRTRLTLKEGFEGSKFNVRKLIVAIAATSALPPKPESTTTSVSASPTK